MYTTRNPLAVGLRFNPLEGEILIHANPLPAAVQPTAQSFNPLEGEILIHAMPTTNFLTKEVVCFNPLEGEILIHAQAVATVVENINNVSIPLKGKF